MYSVVSLVGGKRMRTTYHDSGVPIKSVEVSASTPLTTAEEKEKRWFGGGKKRKAKAAKRRKVAKKAKVGIRNLKELQIALTLKKHGKPTVKKFSLR